MRTILTIIFLALFFLLTYPLLGIEWIISKFKPKHTDIVQLRIVQVALRCVEFISGMNITVKGKENIPKDEAVLYVSNHRGFYDIVITYSRVPDLTSFISKDSIGKVPFLRLWMKRLHCLFLKRDDLKQGMQVILKAIDNIKNGISICIFPEGTRSKEKDPSKLGTFKEGSFKIASKTKCKIVPIAITGTDDVFENHFPWIKKANVTLTFGEPIDTSSLSKEELKHLGAHCQGIIQNMLKS
ncbi:MAG: lysophospholipid acyltransferase family protein [Agathobacter sp.]|nr:lysophospholipid acyltransferase family protein [Agathobacter sp.]